MNPINHHSEFKVRGERCLAVLDHISGKLHKARTERLVQDYIVELNREYEKSNNAPLMDAWDMLEEMGPGWVPEL